MLKKITINEYFTIIRRIGKVEDSIREITRPQSQNLTGSVVIQEIQGELEDIKTQLHSINTALEELQKKFSGKLDQIQSILKAPQTNDLDENHNKIKSIEEQMNALPNQITEKMVDYERLILKKIWKWRPTEDEKRQLLALASDIKEKEPFFRICTQLETEISFHPEFSSFYRDVLYPLKNYRYKLTEFRDTLEVLKKKEESDNPVGDIFEIKQKIYFLVFIQYLNEIPELLGFNIDHWFTKKFLNFADQFLRYYQKEILAGTQTKELEKVNTTIIEILYYFEIEPIPIFLGKTQFDSKFHIGKSNTNDVSMGDGVIAEVIKQGFRKRGGDVVIQPEVIVNRT